MYIWLYILPIGRPTLEPLQTTNRLEMFSLDRQTDRQTFTNVFRTSSCLINISFSTLQQTGTLDFSSTRLISSPWSSNNNSSIRNQVLLGPSLLKLVTIFSESLLSSVRLTVQCDCGWTQTETCQSGSLDTVVLLFT